jgi:hypothetical protein
MRNKFFVALMLCCVIGIFLSGCNRNYVSLESTNAKNEVPQLANFVFRFDKSLYPDSLLNTWDSSDYISFEPKITGRFRWSGPGELVFSPSQPLLPATSYKAKITNEVLQYSKYNDLKDADEIKFYTAPLQLNNAQVTWVLHDEASRTAVPQIYLQFNYPVKVDELKDKLNIEVEGKKTDFTIQNVGISNTINVRLNSFKAEDKNYETQIY